MPDSAHKAMVQESFTRQAEVYAVTPTVADQARIARLVEAIAPASESRVLEVACGPGFLALAFAESCREVVGLDLTDAPLAIAERKRRERGLANVRFERGDADLLPFADGEFNVVVCRLALHHVEEPGRVLREMARVCRPQGKVAVEDLVSSEHRARGEYQNQFERLRDPSHTRALAASELLGLFTAALLRRTGAESGALAGEQPDPAGPRRPSPSSDRARRSRHTSLFRGRPMVLPPPDPGSSGPATWRRSTPIMMSQ